MNKLALAILILLVVGGLFASGVLTPQMVFQGFQPSECRVMKPTWGFYRCEKSSTPTQITKNLASPPYNGLESIRYETFYCNFNDVIPNGIAKSGGGFASCSVTVDSQNHGGGLYYKICIGRSCTGYNEINVGKTIYLDFGESVIFQNPGVLFYTSSWAMTENYFKKILVQRSWFGEEIAVKGPGCDLGSVLDSGEFAKLPRDAKLSMNVDERQNFVVGWVDLPTLGNVFDSPTYGNDLICTPQKQFYRVRPFQTAEKSGDVGTYYDKGGNCYLIPEASPVASVECCPGEQLTGKSCNKDGKWVSLDKGECVIGGIPSAIHCLGGGGWYCDLGTHRAGSGSTCNPTTGMCEYIGEKYATCCPPDKGCPGDQYCDTNTYTCKVKEEGVFACNFECCDPQYHPNYQEKKCVTGVCCPNTNKCAASLEECGKAGLIIEEESWFAIIISLLVFGVITSFGLFLKKKKFLIVTGLIGALIAYGIYWFLTLPLWASILLTIGVVGGGVALLYVLMTLGILGVLVIAVITALRRR